MQPPRFNSRQAFSFAWEAFKRQWTFFVPAFIVLFVVTGALSGSAGRTDNPGAHAVLQILSIAFSLVFSVGLIHSTLKVVNGESPEWSDLWNVPAGRFWPYVGSQLLTGLMVMIGCVLLLIPGIYLALRFSMSRFTSVDQPLGTLGALQLSSDLTRGIKWELLGFFAAAIFIIVLGAICLGIGLLVAVPVVMIAQAHVYRQLHLSAQPAAEA